MQTATQFHETLAEAVKASSQEVRKHPMMKVGAVGHQGDVYCHRIDSIPKAWNVEVTEHHQVALGATIGSRHVADGLALKVFWPKSSADAVKACPVDGLADKLGTGAQFCLGPVVVAEKPWALVHPEHAHHEFPAGTFLISYQLDRATMRQVRD